MPNSEGPDKIASVGYAAMPLAPAVGGTIFEEGNHLPKIGLWVMLDNLVNGMLEDFIAFLVPEGDYLLQYVDECLEGMSAEHRRFRPQHRSKAKIHTWLAWQEDPGTPLGLAIIKQYLSQTDGEPVSQFIGWVRQLYAA